MGKRLTPEEREARIKAYEELKMARQAVRLEKRKARAEAYEKAKAKREREKKGVKPAETNESSKVGQVKRLPTYKGEVSEGDELGFRWLGMALAGTLVSITKERNYRVRDDGDGEEAFEDRPGAVITYYHIKDSEGTVYPIRRNDILAKKSNGIWKEKA